MHCFGRLQASSRFSAKTFSGACLGGVPVMINGGELASRSELNIICSWSLNQRGRTVHLGAP